MDALTLILVKFAGTVQTPKVCSGLFGATFESVWIVYKNILIILLLLASLLDREIRKIC